MPGGLTLMASADANIPNPASGKVTIFFSTDSNAPAYKNSVGTVLPLGTTGDRGPMGPAGFGFDGDDGDAPIALPGPQGNPGPTGATGAAGPAGSSGMMPEEPIYSDDCMFPPGRELGNSPQGTWRLQATQALSGAASYDFLNLGSPNEIMVVVTGVTFGGSDRISIRVSVDNSTFLSSSGDYVGLTGEGISSNLTELPFYTVAAVAARSCFMRILACNVAAPKPVQNLFFATDSIGYRLVNNTGTIEAIRIRSVSANNFTGGTAYILIR